MLRERTASPACRRAPNVLFEAGWVFGTARKKCIIVESGTLIGLSDLDGVNNVRMDRGVASLNDLKSRIEGATGHKADTLDSEWNVVARYPSLVRAMMDPSAYGSLSAKPPVPTEPPAAVPPAVTKYDGLDETSIIETLKYELPNDSGFYRFDQLDSDTHAPPGTWKKFGPKAARQMDRLADQTEHGITLRQPNVSIKRTRRRPSPY